MGLRLIPIGALVWFGAIVAGGLARRAGKRNAPPRWMASMILLSVGLVVGGSLLLPFAIRSGSLGLMLVAALLTFALAAGLGRYVTRAVRSSRNRF